MIIFNLECKLCGVNFEGWFENSVEFEKQKKQNKKDMKKLLTNMIWI